ncbi:molecular chaperone GroEL [Hydrogenoanaerobacterium sp.]|nr:molecular chaperone GroEL [Hydrogenoanaerobacterium sp.]
MSYIDPKLADRFESLPIDLKNAILEQNVKLYTLQDLINCLENMVGEE